MTRKTFEVILHKKAVKILKKLPKDISLRVIKALEELEYDPFYGDIKPLKGLKKVFRKRVGKIRIIYYIDFEQKKIVVLKISYRKKAYRSL